MSVISVEGQSAIHSFYPPKFKSFIINHQRQIFSSENFNKIMQQQSIIQSFKHNLPFGLFEINCVYNINTKMKKALNLSKKLPFTSSYKSQLKSLLPVKTAIRNLGENFYPRLIQIHQNLTQSLILNNFKYIQQAAIPELQEELMKIKSEYKTLGCRLKLNEPVKKLLTHKNYIIPQTVFRTGNFYISLACKVYFGGQLDPKGSYAWPPHQKLIRFGKYRYIIYDRSLSFGQNFKLIFSRQIYEFVVKYQTNLYINVFGLESSADLYESAKQGKKYDEQMEQDLMQTEVVMRSSSEKFDWIIMDINGLMKNKYKFK